MRLINILFQISLFILISCAGNSSVKSQGDPRFNEPIEPYITYYLDYDNFTDKLLTQTDLYKIQTDKIQNYIKATVNRNDKIIKRQWYYNGALRMLEYFNDNGEILSQILKIGGDKYVKRIYHYISGRIFKINIYINGKLNAIVEHFYSNKRLIKKRKYNDKYKTVAETFIKYNVSGKVINETEYLISADKKNVAINRKYMAKYKNGKIVYDEQYLYDSKGKYKHFERYYNDKGKIKAAILFSSNKRGKILYINKYKNNGIVLSEAYFPEGKVKTRVDYENGRAKNKTGYTVRGKIIFKTRFDDMGREIKTPNS